VDLDQLSAFDRVVREGGFSRAALALGIGQPAVSSRIRTLEETVGGALFTRGRRIALTALGESFLPYARRALEVVDQGVEAARLAQTGRRGRVKLGALGSLAGGLVGPAMAAFLRRHPEVEATVRSGAHEVMLQLLLDGIVDLALIAWPCPEAPDLTPLVSFHEPVVLVAHPEHPLAADRDRPGGRKRAPGISEAELVDQARPFLKLRWWRSHHPEVVRLAEACGPVLDVSMETARQLVLQNVGAGFFTRTYLIDVLASGALQELEVVGLPRLYRDSALVRRKRGVPLSPASAALVQAIRIEGQRLGLCARTRHR
jgi:DNA-binding transcriptional LysR family regulator